MANTAILLKRNASPDGVNQTVDTLVSNGTNSWLWTATGIQVSANDISVQNTLTAHATDYLAAIALNNEMPLTADQTKQLQATAYAALHLAYKVTFLDASYILEQGLLTGISTLAAYKTVLTNTVTALAPLAGTQFQTHLNTEWTALFGSMILPSAMTLAQCVQFDNLMHVWLSCRKIDVMLAQIGG